MNHLYTSETIYDIPDSKKEDSGKLEHSAIVICRKTDLSGAGLEFLEKIMGALNWKSNKDYLLIQLNDHENLNLSAYIRENAQLIFSFGLEEKELCIQATAAYYTKCKFEKALLIRAHSVPELIQNKEYKGSLWSIIKEYKK